MKRRKMLAVVLSAAILTAFSGYGETTVIAGEENAESYEVTDLVGRTVSVPAEAKSYACIGPGALRLYCYVADDDELAGLEDAEISWGEAGRPYTKSIENKENYPIIGAGGAGTAPDAEMLVAAAPDVIFSCYNGELSAIDELQDKTEIPVVALNYGGNLGEAKLFAQETYDSLELIGKITGNEERAEEVIKFFEDAKADLEERTAKAEEQPAAYFGCMSNQGSHGIESTTGDYSLFDVLNIKNIMKDAGVEAYAQIDKEQLLEMNPETMIIDAGGLDILKEDYKTNTDYYNSLSAFKNGNVYLQMPYNFYTANLDIALADAYYLGTVLYPEQFADVDAAEKFDEITDTLLGIKVYAETAEEHYGGYQQINLDD